MVQMLMEPGSEYIGHGLGKIPSPSFDLGICRVPNNAKIGLLMMQWYLPGGRLQIPMMDCWDI